MDRVSDHEYQSAAESLGHLRNSTFEKESILEQTAYAALLKREERYRLALEATRDGLWDLETGTDNCYLSPGCFHMLGYAGVEETANGDWFSIIHPDDLERARTMYLKCLDNKIERFEIEFRVRTKKGAWKWILIRGKATSRDDAGKALRLVGTFVDISERKQMEQMLRMEHNLLELITSTSPVGIIFVNRDGDMVFANPRVEQILGLPKDQIVRQRFNSSRRHGSCSDTDPLPLRELCIQQVLETGDQVVNDDVTFTRPDGQMVFLSINAAPFLDAAGRAGGTVATFQDITDRKLNEQTLAENAWLLRETQRIAQLGSYQLDLGTKTRQTSEGLDEILGIDGTFPTALEAYFELVHPDFRYQYREGLWSAVADKCPFEMEYKIVRRSDGRERWVAEFCEQRQEPDGNPGRMIGTVQDITERKAAEEAIRSLNDELDRRVVERTSQLDAAKQEMESFSYSVSHDLRAPLRHINSYSDILVEEYKGNLPQQARHYLERICAASSRMGKLIDDLLMLTRVSRTEMKQDSFNISRLATDVAEMLRSSGPECSVQFEIADGLTARGDSILVRLILENLMENALKYSSRNPRAHIEFGRTLSQGKSAFYVRDNGVGFDMSYSDKLFHPFQRLHGGDFEGTGIGLATVKRIVQRHGGNVWAEGVENEGATFYFTLPFKAG